MIKTKPQQTSTTKSLHLTQIGDSFWSHTKTIQTTSNNTTALQHQGK